MKLIVIDPRNAGLANKADVWLRVRPGTDGALALGLANVMIERGWYDRDFMRDWSNGPLLVRADTGRLLRESDLAPGGDAQPSCRLGSQADRPVVIRSGDGPLRRPRRRISRCDGEYASPPRRHDRPAGRSSTTTPRCAQSIRPRWSRRPAGFRAAQLEEAARLIWHARPVSYYAWSGHEQHANTTETARAMALLYALTGSFDAPGGNVLFPAIPAGADHRRGPAGRKAAWRPRSASAERPLGPARWNNVIDP